MGDFFATDDDEIDETLTASIAEIFFAAYGLVLPAHVGITSDCKIVLRPGGKRASLYGNAH